jgi:predicted RNA binding protein YcfA (HicA-like mRNA interferase family)
MTAQVEVGDVERWLRRNGFVEMPRKASGHRYFENGGVKIVLPGHGPKDLTKKHVGMLRRQLAEAGYSVEDFG